MTLKVLNLEIMDRDSVAGTQTSFRHDEIEKKLQGHFLEGWRLPTAKEARILGQLALLEVGNFQTYSYHRTLDELSGVSAAGGAYWTSEEDIAGRTEYSKKIYETWWCLYIFNRKEFILNPLGTGYYVNVRLVRDI